MAPEGNGLRCRGVWPDEKGGARQTKRDAAVGKMKPCGLGKLMAKWYEARSMFE